MAWQEDVRVAVVRGDDEHIIGPGFDEIGDLADPVPCLVEDREPEARGRASVPRIRNGVPRNRSTVSGVEMP